MKNAMKSRIGEIIFYDTLKHTSLNLFDEATVQLICRRADRS